MEAKVLPQLVEGQSSRPVRVADNAGFV
jgi:hypothetical protein